MCSARLRYRSAAIFASSAAPHCRRSGRVRVSQSASTLWYRRRFSLHRAVDAAIAVRGGPMAASYSQHGGSLPFPAANRPAAHAADRRFSAIHVAALPSSRRRLAVAFWLARGCLPLRDHAGNPTFALPRGRANRTDRTLARCALHFRSHALAPAASPLRAIHTTREAGRGVDLWIPAGITGAKAPARSRARYAPQAWRRGR
jgi:hypothetical protein